MTKRLTTLCLVGLLLATTVPAVALVTTVAEQELVPSGAQRRATKLITHFIANYHYKKTRLSDELSEQVLERYLENLDPSRNFLIAEDVNEFNKRHRRRMDDYLRDAELEVAYEIFLRYRQRVSERIRHAKAMLDGEFRFDIDEEFEFDRTDAPWAAEPAELDEIWRKRVKNDVLSLQLAGKSLDELKQTLLNRYEGLERRTKQLNSEDVYQLFINAYTTSIEPHTSYFSPRTSENFKIRMSLSLEGIGAVLQNEDQFTIVREIVPGGPADKSGKLHADDRITGVGQGTDGEVVDVIGWRLDDVVDLIRGPKDSVVQLELLPKGIGPEGPSQVITITRNKISLEEQAAKKTVIELPQQAQTTRIGVITVPTFYLDFEARSEGDRNYRSTTRDVRKLIHELASDQVEGILIDLRGNGGGSLSEATELTGLFIETGPIVQVRNADGRIQTEKDKDPVIEYDGPLAVLVDRNSASASEIFAGAIQDYRRGVIIGEPTFGKGTVQNLVDLDRFDTRNRGQLGQLKATIAQFFRIGGGSTQHRGVVPDVIFPTALDSAEHGERALDNALPWDEVKPANYIPSRASLGPLSSAIERHRARVLADDGFQVLLEESRLIQQAEAKTTVSLLETARRDEQESAKESLRQRQKRLRAARGLPPLEDDVEDADSERNDDEAATEDDPDEPFDVVLTEAARVLSDLVLGHGLREAYNLRGPDSYATTTPSEGGEDRHRRNDTNARIAD